MLALAAQADEPDYRCPIYNAPQRLEDHAHIDRQLEFQHYSRAGQKSAFRPASAAPARVNSATSANFIDDHIFGKIVSVNMLGMHASVAQNVTGLREVTDPDESWNRTPK